MHIAVVGSGYVGLVAGACFADLGHDVILVDNDQQKLASLKAGQVPIHENFLPELLQRHRGRKLNFSDNLQQAVRASAAIFIAVGTPPTEQGVEQHRPHLPGRSRRRRHDWRHDGHARVGHHRRALRDDARERARADGRARRRRRDSCRHARAEVVGRVRPDAALRGLGGDPGRHYGRHGPPAGEIPHTANHGVRLQPNRGLRAAMRATASGSDASS